MTRSNSHIENLLAKSTAPLWTLVFVSCCFTLTLVGPSAALTCYCDLCPNNATTCTVSDHRESRCYRSLKATLANGTYVLEETNGCLSGSNDTLFTLQCYTPSPRYKEPSYLQCCNDEDNCNKQIPDPTAQDDPRWDEVFRVMDSPTPPELPKEPSQIEILPIVVATLIVTLLCVLICRTVYKISILMYKTYWTNLKSKLHSQNSIRSSTTNFDEQLKNQFISQSHNMMGSYSSSHTCTISDFLPIKPDPNIDYEHSIASLENTTTLPDVTSGIGTKVLVPRTMARVVDCGVTVDVGSGRFGRVFRGSYHGDDVAVKAFQAMDHESWHREENILRKLNHDNIVRLIASETYTISETGAVETWMFLEFCPYGSLCDFLDCNEICGVQQAVKMIHSIIKGLSYLHDNYTTGYKPPIAHRDIKSRNILMKAPDECKLADFGHAVVQINDEQLDFGGYDRFQVGTIRYMAPEILNPDASFDPTQFHTFAQADLYQFALVLWEICHRTTLDVLHPCGPHSLPYDDKVPQNPGIEDMIQLVCNEKYRPPRPLHWDNHSTMSTLSSLMVECWRPNPKARMETLGVKKRIQELYDQVVSQRTMIGNNLLDMHPFLSKDKDKFKGNEFTF